MGFWYPGMTRILIWLGLHFFVVVNQNYAVIHNLCLGERNIEYPIDRKTQTWRCIMKFRSGTYRSDVEWRSSKTPEVEHDAVLLTFGRRPYGPHRFGQKQGLCSGRCRIYNIYQINLNHIYTYIYIYLIICRIWYFFHVLFCCADYLISRENPELLKLRMAGLESW